MPEPDSSDSLIGNAELAGAFRGLSTPLVADACMRVGLPLRLAPPGLSGIVPGLRAAGRVAPAQHFGSVDVFLEAIDRARAGDVLVIDNGGRSAEACIGDLTVLEARAGGLEGMLVCGAHRDTAELVEIGFPVFSYGRCPAGPRRVDPRNAECLSSARFGEIVAGPEDAVFADDDGAVFVPLASARAVIESAREIHSRERHQAQAVAKGRTLREQFRFTEYLRERAADPSLTLRRHLERIGGAIEV